jgi:DNA polymerase III epsilon subunit-like protein
MTRGSGKKTERNEIYISVDVETAGPIPGLYSMLSLGACVVGSPNLSFYTVFQPISEHFIPEALEVSGFTLDELAKTGRPSKEAMTAFHRWVKGIAAHQLPVIVGFNASFDWAFLNWYFHTFLGENPLGIGALDIKSFYMGLSGCLWQDTTSNHLPRQYRPTHQQTHNALDDAIAQAEIFQKLLTEARKRSTPT